MKRLFALFLILTCISGMTFAADSSAKNADKSKKATATASASDKNKKTPDKAAPAAKAAAKNEKKSVASDKPFAPGVFTVQAGLGTGFFSGVDVYGGCEYGLGTFKLTPQIPLTYGVGLRVGYYGYGNSYNSTYGTTSYSYGDNYSNIAVSVMATVHLNWGDYVPKNEFAKRLESYVGLGIGGYMYGYSYTNSYYPDSNSSTSSFRFAFTSIEGNNWYFNPHFALNVEGGYYTYYYGGRLGILYKF